MRLMKFIGWVGDKALFRKTTFKEKIKWLFQKPNPDNIIVDMDEWDKILAEHKND